MVWQTRRRIRASSGVLAGGSYLILGAMTAACSFLVDTNANQCSVDDDCASFGAHYTCSQYLCVGPSTTHDASTNDALTNDVATDDAVTNDTALDDAATNSDVETTFESGGNGPETGGECQRNSECSPGDACVSGACVSLTSAECPTVLGAGANGAIEDESVVFGAILPTPVTVPPTFLESLSELAKSMTASLSLAVSDFASVSGLPAVPGSTGRRPVVFVTCADNHSAPTTTAATKHLVSDLGVAAIVGSGYSTFTNAIASQLSTLQSSALLLAPRTTGSGPSAGGTNTWHVALPDNLEAEALASVAKYVGSTLDGGGSSTVIAYKGDEYGTNVATLVSKTLPGAQSTYSYGNSDDPAYTPDFSPVVATVVAASPQIVVLVGTDEAVVSIVQAIETNWSSATRPRYVLSSGLLTPGLWQQLAASDPTMARNRILGVAGGSTSSAFSAYQSALEQGAGSTYAITSGAPEIYDAAYLLAYGTVAIGSVAVTGPHLVAGFAQLSGTGGAPLVSVGSAALGSTFQVLAEGQPIALQGATGSLALKPASQGRSSEEAQVWCIPARNSIASEPIYSGLYVDATGTVQGTLSASCN
jgi:ABC-type branched-subunit amino acid transport system substrate-binding protein